jgi:Rod binding domain-containing protein
MNAGVELQTASLLARPSAVQAPHATANAALAKKAATQFEGVFISEFLGQMFEGVPTDGPFGGGPGESMFRSLLLDEYGKQIASRGGFGLADAISRQLLVHQEQRR